MKLYRFLEPGELIADGDEFCTGIHWRLTVTNPGVPAGDRHFYRRFVAEVPDDANIAAALIAAEVLDNMLMSAHVLLPEWAQVQIGRYRAAKAGA